MLEQLKAYLTKLREVTGSDSKVNVDLNQELAVITAKLLHHQHVVLSKFLCQELQKTAQKNKITRRLPTSVMINIDFAINVLSVDFE